MDQWYVPLLFTSREASTDPTHSILPTRSALFVDRYATRRRGVYTCKSSSVLALRLTLIRHQPEVYFRLGPGKELDPEVEKLKREMNQHRI